MTLTRKEMLQYTNSAEALADSVKRDIQKDGIISTKSILALNDFVIAANLIADIIEQLKAPNKKLN